MVIAMRGLPRRAPSEAFPCCVRLGSRGAACRSAAQRPLSRPSRRLRRPCRSDAQCIDSRSIPPCARPRPRTPPASSDGPFGSGAISASIHWRSSPDCRGSGGRQPCSRRMCGGELKHNEQPQRGGAYAYRTAGCCQAASATSRRRLLRAVLKRIVDTAARRRRPFPWPRPPHHRRPSQQCATMVSAQSARLT